MPDQFTSSKSLSYARGIPKTHPSELQERDETLHIVEREQLAASHDKSPKDFPKIDRPPIVNPEPEAK